MHAYVSVALSLSLSLCVEGSGCICNICLFHVCDILHHFGSSVVPSLSPSFSIFIHFFPSFIGVPSSFIAICFRCVVFLTSFYSVLSPPLWLKKDTSLSYNLNCGFRCTAFPGWRVITHWDPNVIATNQWVAKLRFALSKYRLFIANNLYESTWPTDGQSSASIDEET